MRAGDLDRQVLIEKKSVTQDPTFGTEVITWVPLVAGGERFAANVQDALPSRAESVLNGDIAIARNQTRIRIRWRDDVTSAMRVTLYGDTDRVMQIVGGPAEVFGRKKLLEIMCERLSS